MNEAGRYEVCVLRIRVHDKRSDCGPANKPVERIISRSVRIINFDAILAGYHTEFAHMVIARSQVEAEAADDLISRQEHTCAAFGCAALLAELDILAKGTYERVIDEVSEHVIVVPVIELDRQFSVILEHGHCVEVVVPVTSEEHFETTQHKHGLKAGHDRTWRFRQHSLTYPGAPDVAQLKTPGVSKRQVGVSHLVKVSVLRTV